jgi:hypothetical protein
VQHVSRRQSGTMAFGKAIRFWVSEAQYAGRSGRVVEHRSSILLFAFTSSNIKDQVGPREAGTSPGSACWATTLLRIRHC